MPQNHIWIFTITGKHPIHVAASLPYVDSTRIVELEYDMDIYLRNHVPREELRKSPISYVEHYFLRHGIKADICFPLQYEI